MAQPIPSPFRSGFASHAASQQAKALHVGETAKPGLILPRQIVAMAAARHGMHRESARHDLMSTGRSYRSFDEPFKQDLHTGRPYRDLTISDYCDLSPNDTLQQKREPRRGDLFIESRSGGRGCLGALCVFVVNVPARLQ